jgi:hypothetical protein
VWTESEQYHQYYSKRNVSNELHGRIALLVKPKDTQLVKKLPAIYGTQGSLPYSQNPATGPYHQPNESSPHHHAYNPKIL